MCSNEEKNRGAFRYNENNLAENANTADNYFIKPGHEGQLYTGTVFAFNWHP